LKRYLPKNAEDASALIITLLVVVLLSTIAVSFLSTARIEQTATRNYSSKTMAEQFAISATEQAMAKIEQGFNATGNGTGNFTSVLTTQPGAIKKYFFSNGTLQTNRTITTELFTSGSGNLSYLNNLQNPSSNATLTSNSSNNQWTITGNASDQINVPMENITSNGTIIGRIAYYVDDEGAKLNLNAATGDRPTLNVGSSRSLSLSTLVSAAQATNFTQTINGTTNTPTSIQTWAHFFRPEQLAGLFGANAAISGNLSKFSAAPVQVDPAKIGTTLTSRDYHLKKTPWGTDRLFINDLPIDSTGVNAIYEALSGKNATTGNPTADQGLRNIYGTNFAEKYTDEGLKQIAANILQARDPNVLNDWNKSFTYNGSLLGAKNATTDLVAIADCCDTANATRVIPKDYLGNAPYPMLNEIGVTVVYGRGSRGADVGHFMRLMIRPYISILNPWRVAFPKSEVDNWEIQYQIDSFRVQVVYKFPYNGSWVTRIFDYGPQGYKLGDAWGHTYTEVEQNSNSRDSGRPSGVLEERYQLTETGFTSYSLNGTFSNNPTYAGAQLLTPFSEDLSPGEELQFPCPPIVDDGSADVWHNSYQLIFPEDSQIVAIRNIVVKFEYIRLLAKSRDGTTIRDWILGEDLEVDGWLQAPHPTEAWPDGYPRNVDLVSLTNRVSVDYTLIKPPPNNTVGGVPIGGTVKRLDGRLKTAANMRGTQRPSMKPWSGSSRATWPDKDASGSASKINNYDRAAFPGQTQNNDIPGDPTRSESIALLNLAYDPETDHLDSNDWPKIQFTNPANGTGIFTAPTDLGKIQTNALHRKLRFTTQHPKEVALGNGGLGNATYIPDWAMLDVISFGSNVTTVPLPAPVNLNGRFHVPSGSPQPMPRTAGLESVLKALDSASLLGNSYNPTNTFSTNKTQFMGSSGIVSSTIAGNIGNLTWSTGNFSSGSATWGRGNSTNDPGSRRKTASFPVNQIVLPSEVTEIRGVSDVVSPDSYPSTNNIKRNEGCLSALFPGATTQSRFFTIYVYAQAGQLQNKNQPESASNPFIFDSEAVTKALVEVEEQTPVTTPPTYKVKKLYTQPISVQ
jgi:hypothetical protein